MLDQPIPISARVAFTLLGSIVLCLLLAYIMALFLQYSFGFTYVKGLAPLFHLDIESNIPSLFSAFQLFLAFLFLGLITYIERLRGSAYVVNWLLLTVGFLYLAFDEAVQFHENFRAFGEGFKWIEAGMGVSPPIWILSGTVIVLALGLFFLKFLLRLDPSTRLHFIGSGSLYVLGSVGIEGVGRHCYKTASCSDLGYDLLVLFEEGLEMIAITYFIWSLLRYCAINYSDLRLVMR